jgi:membrane-associated phospholipid phosphatase
MAMKGEAESLRPLVYATLVAGTAALATAIAVSDFTYDQSLNGILGGLFILIVGGVLLRRFRLERLGSCMEGMALLFAISALASLSSFLLAATALPYADAELAAFDARFLFGFSWRGLIELIKDQDRLLYGFSWVYTTLNWQPALVVALLFFLRRSEDAWTFIAAWTLTLMATMALFPFLPAVAGYLHYGIPRTEVPFVAVVVAWSHIDILDAVRDGSLRAVTPSSLAGIVTFPSFHAAASVLLAWGFMRIRFLGAAGIALNVAMLLSSIVIGGHYLVDVVAGAAIAAAALLLAVRMRAWAARRSPSTLAVAGAEPA